jgi:hypothetical protein
MNGNILLNSLLFYFLVALLLRHFPELLQVIEECCRTGPSQNQYLFTSAQLRFTANEIGPYELCAIS